jgi:serine/threonine-protein kinase ATR
LTPNLVDALGATGVDGVYRKGCEITMEVLRENKDSLISVLEAFIHDPLVEWQEAKKREVRAIDLSCGLRVATTALLKSISRSAGT